MKVIKIGAVWCSGCLVMKPRWAEIEKELPDLKTEYFDYDTKRAELKRFGVSEKESLPLFIFLDDNDDEITRMSGEIDKETLLKVIRKHMHR